MDTATMSRRKYSGALLNVFLVVGALSLGKQVVTGGSILRIYAAMAIMAFLAVPAIKKPQSALLGLFAWLPFLGLVRRALLPTAGWASLDPMLLVSTAVSLTIAISLMMSREAKLGGTPLSMMMFGLIVLEIIELFNPLQGSVLVALTGVMFIIAPMTLFIVARTISDDAFMRKVMNVVMSTGFITALWGLKQVYLGFTGFETQWLKCCAYGALTINKTVRPFSTFSNSVEFAAYMGFAIVACYSRLLYSKGKIRVVLLAAIVPMAWIQFLIGSRGAVFGTGLAVITLTGLRARNRFAMVAIMATLIGAFMLYAATHSTTAADNATIEAGTKQLVTQQQNGLLDPTDAAKSTLPLHAKRVWQGIAYSMTTRPAGLGTGAITRGSSKFGKGTQAAVELDFGNAFLAFGVVGGLLYFFVVLQTFRQLYILRRRKPDPMWVAVLGICILSIGQWQNGGAYAIASLIWFVIGASDKAFQDLNARPALEEEDAAA
ncbi:MAG: hypothetical protein LC750_14755 [Actinobacteria bacterium]|nr:hypothetical protein [Actinomycetota bacterium]